MNVLLDVFICPFRKKSAPHLPEGTVKCSYLAPYKIHRAHQEEETKWRYCQGKSFIGTSDTARHLKTFRIISNEKLILFLILCQ